MNLDWKDTDLFNIANVVTGKKDANHAEINGKYKFFTCALEPLSSPDFSFEGRVLILPGNGANVGEVFFYDGKFQAYQRTYIVKDIKTDVRFLYFYFLKDWRSKGVKEQYGSATNYIKIGNFKDFKIPLPPLAEQKEIARRLDVLMGHYKSLKTQVDAFPQILKDFRQSVLHQAVTGKLTDSVINVSIFDGQPESEVLPKGWKRIKIIDLAKLESGHTPRKSVEAYWENGEIPWISLRDIRAAHGKTINETEKMPTQLGIANSSARVLPRGTVCFSRDISVGFTTIMGKEMATTQHFANWICGDSLDNKFLLYAFMQSKDYLTESGQGTTVRTLYMPQIKRLTIALPPRQKQKEIVARVEKLFAIADRLEQQYQNLKAKLDVLPQALLNKAFSGRLTAQWRQQNPELITGEHRAEVLLKKLKGEGLKGKGDRSKVRKYGQGGADVGLAAEEMKKYKSKKR